VDYLSVEAEDRAEGCLAEPERVLGDRLEHGLHVRLGRADDPEDLTRRRLLLEGLRQVAVAYVQLLEQAHVLDGDDGLVGERLHQLDLLVREGMNLPAVDDNGAQDLAFLQERYA